MTQIGIEKAVSSSQAQAPIYSKSTLLGAQTLTPVYSLS